MSAPYVGEIRMVGFNFQVNGWAYCNGQLLSIAENETLFNLIGTTYGGDGQVTFAVPDLRGRAVIHQGGGYVIGQSGGTETTSLITSNLPVHSHAAAASGAEGTSPDPAGNVWAASAAKLAFGAPASPTATMAAAVASSGGGQPHENMPPFLTINFIIALYGIFPSQN